MKLKKYFASFLVVFMLFFSSVFTPIQTARAIVPLILGLTAEQLAAAATLIVAGGVTYANKDAVAATAHKFIETMSDADRSLIRDSLTTGKIQVSASLFFALKSFIDHWNYVDGEKIEYNNPIGLGTLKYSNTQSVPYCSGCWDPKVQQGVFVGDYQLKSSNGINWTHYLKMANGNDVYVEIIPSYVVNYVTNYKLRYQVKNASTGQILWSENSQTATTSVVNSRLHVEGSTISWFINGALKWSLSDSNPRLTRIRGWNSFEYNVINNAQYFENASYLFNSTEALLDRGITGNPTFDLTGLTVYLPQDSLGQPILNVDGIVGVQPGQIIVKNTQYEEAKDKGEPVPDNHSTTEDRGLPTVDKPFSSKDRIEEGNLVQRRYYDKDGNAEQDIDYEDHGIPEKHSIPHKHTFDHNKIGTRDFRSKPINNWDSNGSNPNGGIGGNIILSSYTFEQFREDINNGHEFSLTYNGVKYGISRGEDDEWFLANKDGINIQQFISPDDLISNATVEGRHLQDIWTEVTITGVF